MNVPADELDVAMRMAVAYGLVPTYQKALAAFAKTATPATADIEAFHNGRIPFPTNMIAPHVHHVEQAFVGVADKEEHEERVKRVAKMSKPHPIWIGFKDPHKPYLLDGMHRIVLAHLRGQTKIPAILVEF